MKRGLAGIAGLAVAGWMGILFAQEPPPSPPPTPVPPAEPVLVTPAAPASPPPSPSTVPPAPEPPAAVLPARPPEPPPDSGSGSFTTRAWYWAHFAQVSSFPLDETGFEDGLTWSIEHRLRVLAGIGYQSEAPRRGHLADAQHPDLRGPFQVQFA